VLAASSSTPMTPTSTCTTTTERSRTGGHRQYPQREHPQNLAPGRYTFQIAAQGYQPSPPTASIVRDAAGGTASHRAALGKWRRTNRSANEKASTQRHETLCLHPQKGEPSPGSDGLTADATSKLIREDKPQRHNRPREPIAASACRSRQRVGGITSLAAGKTISSASTIRRLSTDLHAWP